MVQVSKRELTHIHLDYARVEFLLCIKKNKKINKKYKKNKRVL